jgi:hypothetical protein
VFAGLKITLQISPAFALFKQANIKPKIKFVFFALIKFDIHKKWNNWVIEKIIMMYFIFLKYKIKTKK